MKVYPQASQQVFHEQNSQIRKQVVKNILLILFLVSSRTRSTTYIDIYLR